MILIGINGFKTSGKDTTYGIVREALRPDRVDRAAFADKLKIIAARALGFDEPDVESYLQHMDDFKESGEIHMKWNWFAEGFIEGEMISERRITGREYLQYFGANAREVFGDSFWVDQILPTPSGHPSRDNREVDNERSLLRRYPQTDVLCVTDVRYPNEAQRIKDLGGVVWEVLRPGLESDGHSSEKPLPPSLVDYKIVNDGDLEVLRGRVVTAIEATL